MTAWLAVLAGAVVLLLWPPHTIRRIDPRGSPPQLRPGRGDAYPMPWRLAASATVFALAWFLWPTFAGSVVALALAAGVLAASAFLRRPTGERVLARELPDALEFLAVCLEAGAPTSAAVSTVADVSPRATAEVLERVLAHLAVGRGAEQAWQELREHPVWGLPARDLVRSARSGTSLVATLRIHAEDARRSRRDAETKRARTVGVKSVLPLMACFLPAFVLIGVVPIVASLLADFFG